MRLRTFTARTMTEAMGLVRAHLGPEAIIVSTQEDEDGGMRVTAALDGGEPWTAGPVEDDAIDIIGAALGGHGLAPALVEKILAAALPFDVDEPEAALAGALDALYGFAPVAAEARQDALLFVGPPGAGKTVTIAKLATRLVMAGRAVRLVTADTVRAGGIQQLQAFADILRLRLHTVENAHALDRLPAARPGEVTLVDTPGVNPFSAGDRRELAQLIAASDAEPVLVMAAGGDSVDATEMAQVFHSLGCTRLTVTRLDMAHRLGSVVSAGDATGLSFCEAGIAPAIADGLAPFTSTLLARLLLTGAAPADRNGPARRGST
jgi:flagellar biosynthesis protein FlhF